MKAIKAGKGSMLVKGYPQAEIKKEHGGGRMEVKLETKAQRGMKHIVKAARVGK